MTSNSSILSSVIRKSYVITTIITFILLFSCCTVFYTKDNYIKDFDKFIQDVKSNSSTFSEADWSNADIQFEKLSVEQYDKFKVELSDAEIEKIGKLKGVYALIKFKKDAKDAIEQTKDIINQAKGALEEVVDSINN